MKKIFVLLALAVLPAIFAACSCNEAEPAHVFTPVTGWDMMERLGKGINIGNTMEANAVESDWWNGCPIMEMETVWGNPEVSKWDFDAIAAMGFNSVRIPVHWTNRMDDDLKIHPAWMNRVQATVDWALDAGLYVVINTHHERNLYDPMHYGPFEDAERWLLSVWTQIAERFKYYPERLIFEPMNEPRPGLDGWFWCDTRFAEEIPVLAEKSSRLNHAALDLIRQSGGYNDRRVVMMSTIQGGIDTGLFDPPEDDYFMLGGFLYFGSSDADDDRYLTLVREGIDAGIPMVMKETTPVGAVDFEREVMIERARRVYGILAEMGVPAMIWNTSGDERAPDQLFNRNTSEWNYPLLAAFFEAYGGSPGQTLPRPIFPHELPRAANLGGLVQWIIPPDILGAAEVVIVEIALDEIVGEFLFSANIDGEGWTQFRRGDERITEEPEGLTFDLTGLELLDIGFVFFDPDDFERIRRAYLM